MNADHFFAIGHTHDVCEDFALSGVQLQTAYAIVCDGCSASMDVDFGARALAYSARMLITRAPELFLESQTKDLGEIIVRRAAALSHFDLPPTALDATLLCIGCYQNRCRLLMWGDGVCVIKHPDLYSKTHLDYTSGAPYYLSYRLEAARLKSYQEQFGTSHLNIETVLPTALTEPSSIVTMPYQHVVDWSGELRPGTQICVMSDGVNQFRSPTSEPIDWSQIVSSFTDFKNTHGVFVQRRLQAFTQDCAKKQVVYNDDTSVAAIAL